MVVALAPLPTLSQQADRLIQLGVQELAGLSRSELLATAADGDDEGGLLVVDPQLVAPSALAPLLQLNGKPGFVVADMADVDEFAPITEVRPPDSSVYLVHGLDRGDDLANWSPHEALGEIRSRGRSPLTLTEGIHWLLQQPDALERNHCFMTIGSRLTKSNGTLDARTPALWISNGTGRDGAARRHAPKVGWCWAGNRHTWLGFASAASRSALGPSLSGSAG